MAVLLKNALADGQTSFERGVDTYRAPIRVPRNQCCLLINNTTRQDFVGPRLGWRQIPLKFVDFDSQTGQYVTDTALQTAFETGFFQGFSGYRPDQGPSHLVFSISGRLFRVDPLQTGTVQEILLQNGNSLNRPTNRPHVYFEQAELFLIIQDGQSVPLFYWGAGARESDVAGTAGVDADGKPLNEVPVGTCMAYSGGRLWVAINEGTAFVAGDGVYGPTGTAAFQRRDAVLKFTENNYLAGGFPFPVPANLGPIRAMAPLANLDTSLGQGPLQIFTTQGALSIAAPLDRALWAVLTDPIRTVSLIDKGALSATGLTLVNGDVWYRALDGVRSYFISRRNFGQWGNHAMSYEVIRHLKDDDWALLDYCSMAPLDNRMFCTVSPLRNSTNGVIHRGLVLLDFIPITSVAAGSESFASEPPCWDGLWAGPDILAVRTIQSEGVDHLYAAVLAPEDLNGVRRIQLWEMTRDTFKDVDASGNVTRISRVQESPRLDFQNRLEQKLLEGCEVWADQIKGTVDFTLLYRPDEYPCWFPWKHWQICAKDERCSTDAVSGCVNDLNLKEQYRARMSGLRPPDNTISSTGTPSRLGFSFQVRLEVIGEAEVTAIKILATRIPETSFGTAFPETAVCEEIVCCPPDDIVSGGGSSGSGVGGGGGGGGGGDNNPSDIGACCVNGVCSITTRALCASQSGTFLGKGTDCTGSPCAVTPPQPAPPEWPVPAFYACTGRAVWQPGEVQDPVTGISAFVGIAPGAMDPITYLTTFGQPGCLEAWSAAVWSDFLASGTPYSQARLIWQSTFFSGKNWMGIEVYPNQAGNYHGVINLDTAIFVEYCP